MDNTAVDLHDTIYNSKNKTRRWIHEVRRQWIKDAIGCFTTQRQKPIDHALEIGPGGGEYLPLLSALARQVTVTDISMEFLDHVKEKFADLSNIIYMEDDITSTKLPPSSFDLILCSEVIEHIPSDKDPLSPIATLLASNGNVILTTPQRYSLLEMASKIAFLPGIISLIRMIYQEPITKTGHINLRTRNELRNQISKSGLQVLDQEVIALYIPFIAEFLGSPGLSLQKSLSRHWKKGILSNLLWTQCYRLTV